MKRNGKFLMMLILLFLTAGEILAGVKGVSDLPVEVTAVRNLGRSPADETKSIIEVEWRVNSALHPSGESFNLTLEVIYANSISLFFEAKVEDSSIRSTQIEVPAVQIIRGAQPALIKQLRAMVTMKGPAQKNSAKEYIKITAKGRK